MEGFQSHGALGLRSELKGPGVCLKGTGGPTHSSSPCSSLSQGGLGFLLAPMETWPFTL